MSTWTACVNRELHRTPPRHLSYGDPRGLRELREAVSSYLRSARGVNCTPDQVLIVAGSQHALSLCLEVLVDPGGEVWVEDPGYFGTQGAVRASGAQLVPVPVTTEGIDVEYARSRAPNARVAFVTPARQLPLGMTMSLNRRLALLSWAADAESWIVEDDYDSEFRYTSRPLGALQGLDREQCVLFTGTFSKVLFPAIRLGYLVVPESVADAFIAARHFNGFSCPYLEQAALARFMNEGHFERHVRRMRSLYGARRDMLLTSVGRYLRGRAQPGVADGGLGVVLWLQHGDSEDAIAATSHRFGVELLPLGRMTVAHATAPGFFLGFGGLPETEIARGVRVLAKALEEYDRKRRAAV
jgi:GntR family transcriptional regulator/MocR family aminotransferase